MLKFNITISGIQVLESELSQFIGQDSLSQLLDNLSYSRAYYYNNIRRVWTNNLWQRVEDNLYFSRFSLQNIARHIKNRTINRDQKWKIVNRIPDGESIINTSRVHLNAAQAIICDAINYNFSEANIAKGQAGCIVVQDSDITHIGCRKIGDLGLKTLIIAPDRKNGDRRWLSYILS
jgi:hypothetical protein